MIRYILNLVGMLLSPLIRILSASVWSNAAAHIYTGAYRPFFGHIGKGTVMYHKAMKLHGLKMVSVGSCCSFGESLQLTSWQGGHITIGDDCIIRAYAHITAANSITIGNGLLTGTNVLITDNSHGSFTHEHLSMQPGLRPIVSKGPVVIGNNVWLGNNVCIMPGVTIGDGVVVGANSVVTHDIPAYSMAAGIPAKIIKQLS